MGDISDFQASSSNIILRTPFKRRILEMNVSMMMSVTTGSSTLFDDMLSSSKTMNRLWVRSISLSEFRRKS